MRARPASRLPAGAVLLSTVLAASACGLSGCGAVAGTQRVVDRAGLVNDMANRLAQADTLTYTATYQLQDGGTGVLAQGQKPTRASFTYPGGKLVVTREWTADCQTGTPASCAMTPPPSPATDIPEALVTKISQRGLIAPTVVVGLLGAAALDSDASIQQHDTTIAGEWATCVDVSGLDNVPATQFSACITAAGVLASFTGVLDGKQVDIRMSEYQPTVEDSAFALPTDAKITGSPSPSPAPVSPSPGTSSSSPATTPTGTPSPTS